MRRHHRRRRHLDGRGPPRDRVQCRQPLRQPHAERRGQGHQGPPPSSSAAACRTARVPAPRGRPGLRTTRPSPRLSHPPPGTRGLAPALTGQGRVPRPARRPRQRPRHQRPLREDLDLSPEPQGGTVTEAVESSALFFTKLISRGDPEHLEQARSSARLSRWKRRSVSEGAGNRDSCYRPLLHSQGRPTASGPSPDAENDKILF